MPQWQELHPLAWVGVVIAAYHVLFTLLWVILKIIWRRRVASWWSFIGYSGFVLMFWPYMEISRSPRWRRRWLQRAGVKEGDVVLDEGFGMGTSSITAARMVGTKGKVYALDNEPLHVLILRLRAKLRRLKNLKVYLSSADSTRLPDSNVDVVYISDAFHEFPKEHTLNELHRVLKPDGILAIWEERENKAVTTILKQVIERGLFSFVEQEKGFYKLQRV
jgi:ubiquinone/menaquinone biosynthesis C-methylase UbiE